MEVDSPVVAEQPDEAVPDLTDLQSAKLKKYVHIL